VTTLVVDKVITTLGAALAVIAKNVGEELLVLCRHALSCKKGVDTRKVLRHITERLEAGRTLVRGRDVLGMAFVVNAMTTWHEDDRASAGEHKLSTNGTIAFEVALNTSVVVLKSDHHADVARVAMEVVDTKALANTTDATVVAMIDVLGGVVVPELAVVAEVFG
jgi:hypothetical protein